MYSVTYTSFTMITATAPALAARLTFVHMWHDPFVTMTTFPATSAAFVKSEHAWSGFAAIAVAESKPCNPSEGNDIAGTALIARIWPLRCAQCAAFGPPMLSAYTAKPSTPSSPLTCGMNENHPPAAA